MAHLKFTRSVYASIDAVHLMHVSSLKSDLTNNGFMVNLHVNQHTAVFALGFFKCLPRTPWVWEMQSQWQKCSSNVPKPKHNHGMLWTLFVLWNARLGHRCIWQHHAYTPHMCTDFVRIYIEIYHNFNVEVQ